MNRSIFYIFVAFLPLFFSQSTSAGLAQNGPQIDFEFEMKLSQRQGDGQSILFSLLNSGNIDLLINREAFGVEGIVLFKKTKCELINEQRKKVNTTNNMIKLHITAHLKENYFIRLLPGEFFGFETSIGLLAMKHNLHEGKYTFQCKVDGDQISNEEGLPIEASTKQVEFYLPKDQSVD